MPASLCELLLFPPASSEEDCLIINTEREFKKRRKDFALGWLSARKSELRKAF